MSGTVGIKADALSSSSSTARGAADGRSTSFGGTPSRSTFHVIQQLVLCQDSELGLNMCKNGSQHFFLWSQHVQHGSQHVQHLSEHV